MRHRLPGLLRPFSLNAEIQQRTGAEKTEEAQDGQRGLSFPPAPLCHARSDPSVMPAGPPPSCLLCPLRHAAGPPCHSRRWLAGIRCLSLLSLHSCRHYMGKPWIPD